MTRDSGHATAVVILIYEFLDGPFNPSVLYGNFFICSAVNDVSAKHQSLGLSDYNLTFVGFFSECGEFSHNLVKHSS